MILKENFLMVIGKYGIFIAGKTNNRGKHSELFANIGVPKK